MTLRSDEGVPVGLEGTVVGIHSYSAEVVFDSPQLITGTTLHGRCSAPSGRLLRFIAFLNLTKGYRQLTAPQPQPQV